MTDESYLYCSEAALHCRRCGDPLVIQEDGEDRVRCDECETEYQLDQQEYWRSR